MFVGDVSLNNGEGIVMIGARREILEKPGPSDFTPWE
jgi:hypothetical protein